MLGFLLYRVCMFGLYAGGKMKPINGWSILEVDELVLLGMCVCVCVAGHRNRLPLSISCEKTRVRVSSQLNILPSRKSQHTGAAGQCGKVSDRHECEDTEFTGLEEREGMKIMLEQLLATPKPTQLRVMWTERKIMFLIQTEN